MTPPPPKPQLEQQSGVSVGAHEARPFSASLSVWERGRMLQVVKEHTRVSRESLLNFIKPLPGNTGVQLGTCTATNTRIP